MERLLLAVTRIWLPAAISVVGVVLIVFSEGATRAAGVTLAGVGVLVALTTWYVRLSFDSGRDREREEEAREYFTRHGRWPGER